MQIPPMFNPLNQETRTELQRGKQYRNLNRFRI